MKKASITVAGPAASQSGATKTVAGQPIGIGIFRLQTLLLDYNDDGVLHFIEEYYGQSRENL